MAYSAAVVNVKSAFIRLQLNARSRSVRVDVANLGIICERLALIPNARPPEALRQWRGHDRDDPRLASAAPVGFRPERRFLSPETRGRWFAVANRPRARASAVIPGDHPSTTRASAQSEADLWRLPETSY